MPSDSMPNCLANNLCWSTTSMIGTHKSNFVQIFKAFSPYLPLFLLLIGIGLFIGLAVESTKAFMNTKFSAILTLVVIAVFLVNQGVL